MHNEPDFVTLQYYYGDKKVTLYVSNPPYCKQIWNQRIEIGALLTHTQRKTSINAEFHKKARGRAFLWLLILMLDSSVMTSAA